MQLLYQSKAALQASKKLAAFQWLRSFLIGADLSVAWRDKRDKASDNDSWYCR
jgi:hypothetical protein